MNFQRGSLATEHTTQTHSTKGSKKNMTSDCAPSVGNEECERRMAGSCGVTADVGAWSGCLDG
jgi:hypothetical protein